jgi:plasmid maintenance system antidote protein VapI
MGTSELRIEILRKFQTQGDFAMAVGCHESTVSRVLRGRKLLTSQDHKRWADVLGCNPTLLLTVTGER